MLGVSYLKCYRATIDKMVHSHLLKLSGLRWCLRCIVSGSRSLNMSNHHLWLQSMLKRGWQMLQLNMVLYNSFYSNRRPLVDNRVLLLKWDNNIKISGNSDKKSTHKRLNLLKLKKKIENWRRIKREIGLKLLSLKLKEIIVLNDHSGLCRSSPPPWYWIDIIITFIKINKNLKWDFKLNVFITFLQFYNF